MRREHVDRTFRVGDELRRAKTGALRYAWRQRDRRRLARLGDEHLSAVGKIRSEPLQRMTGHGKPGLQCRQQYGVVDRVKG